MPVLISPADVRRYAIGIDDYLDEYDTDDSAVDSDLITPLIDDAETTFERILRIRLKTTRILARPASTDVLGVDYDLEEPPYHYYHQDWRGTPRFTLRNRPIQTVTSVNLEFPSGSTVLEIPSSWYSVRKQFGILSIIPSGEDAAVTVGAAQIWLPIVAASFRGMIPDFVSIDYTAGYADDPANAVRTNTAPDDLYQLREAIAKATARQLIRQAQVIQSMRGNISMDGLSETFSTQDHETVLKGLEEDVKTFQRSFMHTRTAPRMVVL